MVLLVVVMVFYGFIVMVYDEEDEKDNEEKESGRPDYLKSRDKSLAVLRGYASGFT